MKPCNPSYCFYNVSRRGGCLAWCLRFGLYFPNNFLDVKQSYININVWSPRSVPWSCIWRSHVSMLPFSFWESCSSTCDLEILLPCTQLKFWKHVNELPHLDRWENYFTKREEVSVPTQILKPLISCLISLLFLSSERVTGDVELINFSRAMKRSCKV